MHGSRQLRKFSAGVLCCSVFPMPAIAMSQDNEDKAIATRQGYMKLVVRAAGPLFGMAKGEMAYDAGAAKSHAAKLKSISQYPVGPLFLSGTSNTDRPGKTARCPKSGRI